MLAGMANLQLLTLYYNDRDIGKNRVNMQDDMQKFCASEHVCLSKLLLESLDFEYSICKKPLHLCCSVCKEQCECPKCLDKYLNIH